MTLLVGESFIISKAVAFCRGFGDKFKKSRLGATVENINGFFQNSWKNSIIMRFLKGTNIRTSGSVLKKITMFPFTALEFLQKKIGGSLADKLEKSIFCEAGSSYVHNFMAVNTRFWGIMLLCATVIFNLLHWSAGMGINRIILVLSAISAVFVCTNMNIMGFLNTSKLVDFVKACAGVKNISFDFYNEKYTVGKLRLIAAAAVGAVTGVGVFVSPILGLLIPFALFGMLLVLKYPVTGVYAAVFVAPLIPFSSMPLAGICLWTMLSLAIKSITDKNFKWRKEGVGVSLVLFLAVLLVSCVFSFARMNSLVVWFMYLVFVSFYFAVLNTIDTREKLYGLLRLFVISGALVALYGVMQYAFGWTTTNAWIDEEMFEEETMRVYSTLANPNVLGEYLLLVLPVSLVFFLKDRAKSLSKWVYLGITGIVFLCLILTQSRGCWLGFMVSVAVFVTFYEGRWWGFIPLIMCALPFVLPQTIIDRLLSIGNMGDSSTSYRVYIWMGAMGMLRHYVWGGIGMGEAVFAEVYPLFSYNAIIAPHSHNTYLQLLVEGGIPALAAFITVLVVFFKSGHTVYMRNNKKSLDSAMVLGLGAGVAGFLLQSMFDYTFYNYRVMAVFFMVIAISVAMKYTISGKESEDNI